MGQLTTHVLDTALGRPAQGLKIELFRLGDHRDRLGEWTTNEDGRVEGPILEGEAYQSGEYELIFHAGEYLDQGQARTGEDRFLNDVVVRFSIDGAQDHYHVPLLLSPFGYSTYRGS